MGSLPTPSHEGTAYSRPSPAQAAADAIPILVDDTYHVFHLTTPPFTQHHPPRLRSCWSRIRSQNLVDWTRDSQPVLKPGARPSDPDADGVWTGAAVHGPDGNMNIFYTGYNLSQNGKQVILRTKSKDRHGAQFESQGTVIAIQGDMSQFEDIDFRDPYVFFNDAESRYWMLVATRLRNGPHWSRGCIALLTSSNLDDWTLDAEPLYSPNDMFCPECPELFTLPSSGKWYLVYSRFHAPNAGTVYRVADSPRGPFRVPRDGSNGRLDGRRWYAAKSCPRAGNPDQRLYFGWLGDFVDEQGKWLWGGDLGVPRQVSADSQGWLRVDMAPEYRHALREAAEPLEKVSGRGTLLLESSGSTRTSFPKLTADMEQDDLLITFNVQTKEAHSFGLLLQADESDKAFRLSIAANAHDSLCSVALMTDFPPLDDFWADQYQLHLPRPIDGPELVRHDGLDLEGGISVLLRARLVEVFGGGRSLSFRLPAPRADGGKTRRFGWFVEDGAVAFEEIAVHRIRPGQL
ncbi:family 32 glycoside hydrolase [Emericellopsis atlantica]|uniref:beta-fructofuranosidase n=1 Tax=Emericellopsis atlantica TaxID=2614577 RepID=A0A9P7ZTG4_9HYPO|nr:family 32 glycoside hydrolase [Emericellopsis atlantica]KAG9257375.1 family 32 glycoside hydrolase [Emericellopsis atlantica]